MKLVPMVCGSSFKNKGVQTMLDLVMELMPSPLDKEVLKVSILIPAKRYLASRITKSLSQLLAFKIATDPFVGRLAFMRAYSGMLGGWFLCSQYPQW
jgi:elongation factor G